MCHSRLPLDQELELENERYRRKADGGGLVGALLCYDRSSVFLGARRQELLRMMVLCSTTSDFDGLTLDILGYLKLEVSPPILAGEHRHKK